jgi:flavin reductase (DIM6/NTAB) family NADH-FMN oxidoreductase RutF
VTATAEGFRNLFRQVPQPVWILTTRDTDHDPVGVTVSSLIPVSADPPTVLFTLQNDASALPAFAEATQVLAHAVSVDGEDDARTFASSGIDRFRSVGDRHGLGGLPTVPDSCGRMLIHITRVLPVAESALFIGTVQATWLPSEPPAPAVWRDRGFTTTVDRPTIRIPRSGHDDD